MTTKDSFQITIKLRYLLAILAIGAVFGISWALFSPRGLQISQGDANQVLLTPEDFAEPVIVVESIPFSDQPSPFFGVPALGLVQTSTANPYMHSGSDCAADTNIRALLSNPELGEVVSEVDYQTPKEDEYEVFWRSAHLSQTVYKLKSESTGTDLMTEIKKGLLTAGCFTSESDGNIGVEVILSDSSTLNEKFGMKFDSSIYFSTHRRFWIVGYDFPRNENFWTSTGIAIKENYLFLTQVTNFEYGDAEDKLLEKAFLNFESLLEED
jgi:hypothetical protein